MVMQAMRGRMCEFTLFFFLNVGLVWKCSKQIMFYHSTRHNRSENVRRRCVKHARQKQQDCSLSYLSKRTSGLALGLPAPNRFSCELPSCFPSSVAFFSASDMVSLSPDSAIPYCCMGKSRSLIQPNCSAFIHEIKSLGYNDTVLIRPSMSLLSHALAYKHHRHHVR